MPRLGGLDTLIYWTGLAAMAGGALFCLFYPLVFRQRLAFADTTVAAYTDGQGALGYFWLVFWLFAMFVSVCRHYEMRTPIFGNKKIKYGPPTYPRKYPLLMKNKPKHWESPSKIARRKKTTVILAAVILVTGIFSFAMYPLSLCGRNQLHYDGTITVYNNRNQESAHYGLGEIISAELDTCTDGGKNRKWSIEMVLTTADGERFRFTAGSFAGDWIQGMETMAALKEIYGPLVTVEDTSKLWKVALERHLTQEEEALLYALFEAE